MGWFVSASVVSLLLGMILVNLIQPGHNLNLPLPDADASTNLKVSSLSPLRHGSTSSPER
jgi:Na+/H+-dicarboxylate symporter